MGTGQPPAAAEAQSRPEGRPPALLMMVGPPGTGKSHLVRLLVERVSLQVVESDEIRRQIAHPPTYTAAESQRVFYVAHRKIDRLLRQGKNVVFDATNLYEGRRRAVSRKAEGVGARVLIVHTVAPDRVVAQRLRRRGAGLEPADRSEADWEVYVRMKGEFEEIRQPHLVVDTSRDLEPAVEEIVRFLEGDP